MEYDSDGSLFSIGVCDSKRNPFGVIPPLLDDDEFDPAFLERAIYGAVKTMRKTSGDILRLSTIVNTMPPVGSLSIGRGPNEDLNCLCYTVSEQRFFFNQECQNRGRTASANCLLR